METSTTGRRIQLLPVVMNRTGLRRTSIWKKSRDPDDDFPVAVQVSENRKGWFADEIDHYLETRPRLTSGTKAA